jgi:hypoxanthine phosphoribosyltransferase
MKAVLAYPSYDDLHKGCASIVQQFLKKRMDSEWTKYFHPKIIVALSRGGLFPGILVSHMFEALECTNRVIPVAYSSKSGNGDGKNHDNILPPIENERILVIDDIADGGHTLQEVAENYHRQGCSVDTAVLYWKESSVYTPTFHWQKIPADSPWIVFPWES